MPPGTAMLSSRAAILTPSPKISLSSMMMSPRWMPMRIEFRIGIHLGDIIIDDNDIFGDGVNIAARLESIAVPGGISISRAVHDQVRDRINVCFDDKGEIELKNIARPVQVFAI